MGAFYTELDMCKLKLGQLLQAWAQARQLQLCIAYAAIATVVATLRHLEQYQLLGMLLQPWLQTCDTLEVL